MQIVHKIKEILEKKEKLESNIKTAEHAINHVNMSGDVGFFTNSNAHLTVRVSREKSESMLRSQIANDKAELSKIDAQLNAIGALMGVDEGKQAQPLPPPPIMPAMPQSAAPYRGE